MPLAKLVLHFRTETSDSPENLSMLRGYVEKVFAGQVSVRSAEWITDWDAETDDDVPLSIAWEDDPTGTPKED